MNNQSTSDEQPLETKLETNEMEYTQGGGESSCMSTSNSTNADENVNHDKNIEEPNNTQQDKEEGDVDEFDEEGLKKNGYDVVLLGTGLTQSILASALSRAGKSILHCDGNDFYGEREAVFSLGSLMEWTNNRSNIINHKTEPWNDQKDKQENVDNEINVNPAGSLSKVQIHSETKSGIVKCLKAGMSIVTPYGEGIIQSLPATTMPNNTNLSCHQSLVVQLNKWRMADGKSPIAYFGYHSADNTDKSKREETNDRDESIASYYAKHHDIIPTSTFEYQKYVLGNKRHYALDLTPGLLYANSEAVDGLIESGVSHYCEFKSILGLYLFMEQNTSMQSRIQARTKSSANTNNEFLLSRVPCSKGDVFQTKLLSPVEKRKLMKFLQMAFDFATSSSFKKRYNIVEENENNNDTVDNTTGTSSATMDASNPLLEEDVVTSLNERQLQQGRSLYRPQNKTVLTSDIERLQQYISNRTDFEKYLEIEHKLPERLRNIVIFALAMGSSYEDGDSTYSTKQGMNDLSEHLLSLGRYGGTAFLVPLYGTGELSQSFCRSAAVHGGTYLLRTAVKKVLLSDDNSVKSVILDQTCFDHSKSDDISKKKEIPTKHVVVSSDAVALNQVQASKTRVLRRVSILRGKLNFDTATSADSCCPSEQRHIIVIPPNTIKNTNVIQGIALDESVHVAPSYHGENFLSTVLHLTTTEQIKGDCIDILEKAVHSIIKHHNDTNATNIEEIYHLSFSYEATQMLDKHKTAYQGLHICDSSTSITVESAFRKAHTLFNDICPNLNFLKYSQEMDERVKESRLGIADDDDDQDKVALDSAMNLMSNTKDVNNDLDT